MPSISNKTQKPVSVPLPGGKTLHLGPGKTGRVAARAIDGPGIQKLVDAGEIEVIVEDSHSAAGPGGAKGARGVGASGHAAGGANRRSGDR